MRKRQFPASALAALSLTAAQQISQHLPKDKQYQIHRVECVFAIAIIAEKTNEIVSTAKGKDGPIAVDAFISPLRWGKKNSCYRCGLLVGIPVITTND